MLPDIDTALDLDRLRPRLRDHVQITDHRYRGQPHAVLQNEVTSRNYLVDQAAYQFISLLDGKLSVTQALEIMRQDSNADVPDEQAIIELLGDLYRAEMLQFEGLDATDDSLEKIRQQGKDTLAKRLLKPLAIRIRLFDPDALLVRLQPVFQPLFSRTGFTIWLVVMLVGLMMMTGLWDDLREYSQVHALDPRQLLLLFVMFPVVKALHEAGHALATRIRGGAVHEAGIMLLVFIPVPYVDASAASAFENKSHRVVVSAIGIMVELFLAVVALLIWSIVDDGLIREICFSVMLIGSISTLLFNGNPLLRFDGYYVLSDVLEIPNLAVRSNRYLAYLVERYLYRMHESSYPGYPLSERGWYLVYGVLSFLYRIFIMLFIAFFVAGKMFLLGVVLAIWSVAVYLVYPAARYLYRVYSWSYFSAYRSRIALVQGSLFVLAILLIFVVPVPSWTNVEGVLSVPEESVVRTQSGGFVEGLLQSDGALVEAGEPIFKLTNAMLQRDIDVTRAEINAMQYRYQSEFITDKVASAVIVDAIKSQQARLDDLIRQQDNLLIKSPLSGRLRIPNASDLQGRYAKKGEQLGYVLNNNLLKARIVVMQSDVDLVRRSTVSVKAMLSSQPRTVLDATVSREVPAASEQLPSRSLGSHAGGAITVDSRDTEGLRAVGTVFEFDVILSGKLDIPYYGSRVYLQFQHHNEPVGYGLIRMLNNLYQQWLVDVSRQ